MPTYFHVQTLENRKRNSNSFSNWMLCEFGLKLNKAGLVFVIYFLTKTYCVSLLWATQPGITWQPSPVSRWIVPRSMAVVSTSLVFLSQSFLLTSIQRLLSRSQRRLSNFLQSTCLLFSLLPSFFFFKCQWEKSIPRGNLLIEFSFFCVLLTGVAADWRRSSNIIAAEHHPSRLWGGHSGVFSFR